MYDRIILTPDPALVKAWGPLAHVSEAERRRILALPAGQAKNAIASLERDIASARKYRGRGV